MRHLFTITVVASFLLAAGSAVAQGKPYSPKKKAPSELIAMAGYTKAPIVFDFELVGTEQVVNGPRLDFQQTYEAKYWDMVKFFEDAYKNRKPVATMSPDVFVNARSPELIVYGTQVDGEKSRFTLGHPDIPYKFTIDLWPDYERTVVLIHNAVYSMTYSGTMPARAPYKPVGADPVPFRGN